MALSKRLRYEILRRDNHACRYCGGIAPDVALTVDHVVPVSLGGTDDSSNLVTACKDCNAGKSSSSPDAAIVAAVDEKALIWKSAMEIAAQERAAAFAHDRELIGQFLTRWNNWTWTDYRGDQHTEDLPATFDVSVRNLLTAGLTPDDLDELIDVAMTAKSRDTWAYFCGCGWRRIRQAQERAAEIIAQWEEGTP